ncbi:MAG: hypothetical protein ACRD26_03680 [Vicinamibacterales bacterium]
MPFLRVLRDKRGYETTCLVHWFRDGSRQRSRILYVFRTPPGVRVGREALDPAVVREIESQHPDIEFDWRALLDTRQVIDHAAEPRHPRGSKTAARPERADLRRPRRDTDRKDVEENTVPGAVEGDTRDRQLAFLARWYPELRDRIPHRTHDPVRREALLGLVERLNAAGWEREEQIAAGLEAAGEALHRLSRVFSKRRRRPKRSKPSEQETPPSNEPA